MPQRLHGRRRGGTSRACRPRSKRARPARSDVGRRERAPNSTRYARRFAGQPSTTSTTELGASAASTRTAWRCACKSRASGRSTSTAVAIERVGAKPAHRPGRARSTSARRRSKWGMSCSSRTDVAEQEKFYGELLGFVASDRYPGRGAFMRCAPRAAITTCSSCNCPRQARPEPRGVHRARHPRSVRRRAAHLPLRLGDATRAGAASGVVGVLLVLPESGRRADRVLRGRRPAHRPNGSRATSSRGRPCSPNGRSTAASTAIRAARRTRRRREGKFMTERKNG